MASALDLELVARVFVVDRAEDLVHERHRRLLARLGADTVAFAIVGVTVGGALLGGEDREASEVVVSAGNLARLGESADGVEARPDPVDVIVGHTINLSFDV